MRLGWGSQENAHGLSVENPLKRRNFEIHEDNIKKNLRRVASPNNGWKRLNAGLLTLINDNTFQAHVIINKHNFGIWRFLDNKYKLQQSSRTQLTPPVGRNTVSSMSSVEGSRTSFSKVVSFNQYDITENVQHMYTFNDKPSSQTCRLSPRLRR